MESSASSPRFAAFALIVSLLALAIPTTAQASSSPARHRSPVACKASQSARKSPALGPSLRHRRRTFAGVRQMQGGWGSARARSRCPSGGPPSPSTKPFTASAPSAPAATPVAAAPRRRRRRSIRLVPAAQPDPDLSATAGPVYWGAWIGSHLTGHRGAVGHGRDHRVRAARRQGRSRSSTSPPRSPTASRHPCKPYNFPAGEFEHDPRPRRDPLLQLGRRRAPRQRRPVRLPARPT